MSSTDEPREPPHVVVVGAGFAGLACARALGKHRVRVTLIDKNTYHQFLPLLYQVATAQLPQLEIMRPVRGLVRKLPSVVVKQGEVVDVDPATRSVTTAEGHRFSGSHVVLAMGSRPNFFGVTGAAEHSFPLYSARDARVLRDRILRLFEDVDLDPTRIEHGALNFVIVGAGATGVETAGALADMINDVMPQRYHDLQVRQARVILVDHGHVVLAPFSAHAHDYAVDVLKRKHVQLLLGRSVTEVADDRVRFADGSEILSRCVVWAGGMQAPTFAGAEQFSTGRGGRIDAAEDLSVRAYPGVYAVGDLANVAGTDGNPLPQLGSVALQQGQAVARSILADLAGRPAPAFDYRDKGIMAMIGKRAAVAELGASRRELHGTVAFAAWLGVHAWLLDTNRARIDAITNWAWDTFSASRSPAIVEDGDAAHIDWNEQADEQAEQPAGGPTKGKS